MKRAAILAAAVPVFFVLGTGAALACAPTPTPTPTGSHAPHATSSIKATVSCGEVTYRFVNHTGAPLDYLITDVGGTVPFSPQAAFRAPVGKSTFVYHLVHADRRGQVSPDSVELASGPLNTFIRADDVPFDCAPAPTSSAPGGVTSSPVPSPSQTPPAPAKKSAPAVPVPASPHGSSVKPPVPTPAVHLAPAVTAQLAFTGPRLTEQLLGLGVGLLGFGGALTGTAGFLRRRRGNA